MRYIITTKVQKLQSRSECKNMNSRKGNDTAGLVCTYVLRIRAAQLVDDNICTLIMIINRCTARYYF